MPLRRRSKPKIEKNRKVGKEKHLKNIANSRGYSERYQNAIDSLNPGCKKLYPIVPSNRISRNPSFEKNKRRASSFGIRKYSNKENQRMPEKFENLKKKKSTVVKLPKNSRRADLDFQAIEFLNTGTFTKSIEEYNSQVHNLEKFLHDSNRVSGSVKMSCDSFIKRENLIMELEEGKQ